MASTDSTPSVAETSSRTDEGSSSVPFAGETTAEYGSYWPATDCRIELLSVSVRTRVAAMKAMPRMTARPGAR